VVRELFDDSGDGTVVIRLHVQLGAGRTAVQGRQGDALKVRVASPPEKGRANDACTGLVAELADVEATAVALTSGATSRSKRFTVTGVDVDELVRRLELALEEASGNARGRGSVPKSPGSR
jgi:uncharacterized protein (TIGR00251 family)